jgi:hypothetical protein
MLVDISIATPKKFRIDFTDEGTIRSITQLYLSCLGKNFNAGNFRKVIIEISDRKYLENTFENLPHTLRIHRIFDFRRYSMLDKYGKKRMMLDILHEGMSYTAEKFGWNLTHLENTYEDCLSRNLECKWQRNDRYLLSLNKRYYAAVHYSLDSDKFEAFVVFYNKQKEEINRERVIESHPCFVDSMGRMGWDKESLDIFVLRSKDGKEKWEARLKR